MKPQVELLEMPKTLLITGGAGFIGTHLCGQLLKQGHRVRVIDILSEQVHGDAGPSLSNDVELIPGDVRDPQAVALALKGVQHKHPHIDLGSPTTAVVLNRL